MPCFFCIAIGAAVATGVAASAVEGLESLASALAGLARSGVRMTDDTGATRRFELAVAVPAVAGPREKPGKAPSEVPVAVTVYKKHDRVRIQVLTHDVDRREAQAVQDVVAEALGLKVVHRASDQEQHRVHEAVERLEQADAQDPEPGAARLRDRLV